MENDPWAVDVAACRKRQQRLLGEMERAGLELVLLTRHESVQWLTGAQVSRLFAPAAAITSSGRVTLILPSRQISQTTASDDVIPYEEKWHSTMRDDQRKASDEKLLSVLPSALSHVGGEWSSFSPRLVAQCEGKFLDVGEILFGLRRRKDPDELRMLRRANDANHAMYAAARQLVEPGINELDVYSELHAVAVRELGEALTYFGQDFRSNARGGMPRDRKAQAGELYLLDLGVGFRGYHSDNARTFAVGDAPTDAQLTAWQRVAEIFPIVEQTVRPDASCRELFEQVQATLDQSLPWTFNHHLGHGVGLAPHEGPHLNPNWDDTFAEGDFFTVEPGLYHEDLRHGVRLEQNYVVTTDGVECLTDYPLELTSDS